MISSTNTPDTDMKRQKPLNHEEWLKVLKEKVRLE